MLGRLDQVLCLSIILNIFSFHQNSIKVLWGYLYVVLSQEIDADLIVSKNQRRRRICFKEIWTHHETRDPQSLILFLCNFSFPFSFCFRVFVNNVL